MALIDTPPNYSPASVWMNPNPPIRVAVVEDQREMREGISLTIAGSEGMQCVSACATAEEAIDHLPHLSPDVVLMDIQLPGQGGIECIAALRGRCATAQFVVLTVFENDDMIFRALEAGASGYILKTAPPEKILDAIREVHAGGAPMSAQIARRVVERFHEHKSSCPTAPPIDWSLTEREEQVLALLARGLLYKEIAADLGISVDTVRKHLFRIYRKLHVTSRTEAVLKFLAQR